MAGKDKGEMVLNMSPAELKLIALGTRFSGGGKVDYEQMAKYGGYTKGSAQVMYRKALRKLIDAFPVDGDVVPGVSVSDNAGNDPATPSAATKTPKTPRSHASGKKRKDAAAEDQDSAAITPTGGPQTPFAPGNVAVHEISDIAMETPTKKPKKAACKQATSSFTPLNADEEYDFLEDEPLFEPTIKRE